MERNDETEILNLLTYIISVAISNWIVFLSECVFYVPSTHLKEKFFEQTKSSRFLFFFFSLIQLMRANITYLYIESILYNYKLLGFR